MLTWGKKKQTNTLLRFNIETFHRLLSPHLPCTSRFFSTNSTKPSAACQMGLLYIHRSRSPLRPSLPSANRLPVHILIPLSAFLWHRFWLCLTSSKSQIIQINRKQGEAFPLSKETNKPHEKDRVVVGWLCKGDVHRCLRNNKKNKTTIQVLWKTIIV